MLAQEARAEAVKGGDPGLSVLVVQTRVDAPRDLGRRAGRESQDQDLAATGQAFTHGLLVQVDQRVRLAGTRSGEHPQWFVDFVDVEWQRFPWNGAGVLIMRVPVSSSQPGLLRVATPSSRGRQGR